MDPDLAQRDEVVPLVHALGDGSSAHGVSEVDDVPAGRELRAIMRAAGDQLASDLQLDERKVVELRERQPFVAHVLDRDGDVAKPQLLGDGFQQPQLGNGRRGVDLDDESLDGPLIGQLPAQRCDRRRIAKERDRELERDLDRGALGMKAAPILRYPRHRPLRPRGATRTAIMLAPFARITGGNVLTHGSVGSGGETRHKLYNELGDGKLDSVYLQSIPT